MVQLFLTKHKDPYNTDVQRSKNYSVIVSETAVRDKYYRRISHLVHGYCHEHTDARYRWMNLNNTQFQIQFKLKNHIHFANVFYTFADIQAKYAYEMHALYESSSGHV